MRGTYLPIIYMAFIIMCEEGQMYGNSLDSKKMADLKGRISEATEDMAESETVMDISVAVQENKLDENELLVSNDNINVEIKRKYIVHHRGNRKYLAAKISEKHSGITDDNYHGKEAHDHSKVDESSKEHLDSSNNPNIFNKETEYAKGFGKTINTENEYMNIANSDIEYQGRILENKNSFNKAHIYKEIFNTNKLSGHNDNRDNVEIPVKQSITHEEKTVGSNEESVGHGDAIDDDDDESYILSDVESFWDALDAFINIHSSSEHHEKEDPQEAEDLYEYLYTPSGNSPGIDHFLDFLLFVKDVNSAVERIGRGSNFSLNNSSHVRNSRKKRCTSEIPTKRSDNSTHKGYSATIYINFDIFQFDVAFSKVKFFPLEI